jgi:hypothetical protein
MTIHGKKYFGKRASKDARKRTVDQLHHYCIA